MARSRGQPCLLPFLDLVVLGHGLRELVVEHFQGGHVREGGVQQIASQSVVARVVHVVVTEQDTAAEIIDALDGSDPETLDTPQEILEGYQIPATKKSLR